MGTQCERHYCSEKCPNQFNQTWMKSLPDTAKLSQLTIPGSHNSCSFYGTIIAITHSWSLPFQLKAGIRFVDIRLRPYYDTLRWQHGIMYQQFTFDTVLVNLSNFIKENPSETIIMAVQNEFKPVGNTKTLPQLYEEYVRDYKDIIVDYIGEDIELGTIRGKILAIKTFEIKRKNIKTQNNWVVNYPSNIKDKKRWIKTFFNRAVTFVNDGYIYWNHWSGVSDYGIVTPARCAYETNKEVFKYKGRLGVCLLDFPGEELISYWIKQNFETEFPKDVKLFNIKNESRVQVINVNTMKFLCLRTNNTKQEWYCSKIPFAFKIKTKGNQGSSEIKSGDVICWEDGNCNDVFEFVVRRKGNTLTDLDNNNNSKILCNNDYVTFCKIKCNGEKEYLSSDYSRIDPLTKTQGIIYNSRAQAEENEWILRLEL